MSRTVVPSGRAVVVDGRGVTNAIPDIVANRLPLQEGSGSSVADVRGSADGTLNGSFAWVSDSQAIEDYKVDLTASDASLSVPAATPAGSMALPLTTELSSTADGRLFTNFPSVSVNDAGFRNFDVVSDSYRFEVTNDSATRFFVVTPASTSRERVVPIIDTTNNQIKIAVNGYVAASSSISGTFQSVTSGYEIGAATDGSEGADLVADEPMIANDTPTAAQIDDDYQRQPWS